jgi:hypothetical protein
MESEPPESLEGQAVLRDRRLTIFLEQELAGQA